MEHPFVGDLSSKSMEELTSTINRLTKNLAFVSRSSNFAMANQILMALDSYRTELARQQRQLLDDGSTITGSIDIS